ncbi:MAG: nuclear transport factor 2 family protein [Candidatus Sulfotelmatobacter sp.]
MRFPRSQHRERSYSSPCRNRWRRRCRPYDQGGVTLGRAALVDSVKKNICGTTTRELVPSTLQIYYMKGYGAIEMGAHRFHHPGHPEIGDGEGKFVHLWQYKDGSWKVTRVLSYDHHAAGK